jgi:hypothetical protein
MEVWGHSAKGWTPIMLRLRGLYIDANPAQVDSENFERLDEHIDDPIFSMMYLHGSIKEGELVDKWTTPGPSATNAVLLWPDTLEYFASEAKKVQQRNGPA